MIGPAMDTALSRYLAGPVVPTVLGRDARLQLLHEQDALGALETATELDAAVKLRWHFNPYPDGRATSLGTSWVQGGSATSSGVVVGEAPSASAYVGGSQEGESDVNEGSADSSSDTDLGSDSGVSG